MTELQWIEGRPTKPGIYFFWGPSWDDEETLVGDLCGAPCLVIYDEDAGLIVYDYGYPYSEDTMDSWYDEPDGATHYYGPVHPTTWPTAKAEAAEG